MDIGAGEIMTAIASGTSQYLVTYSPVFLFAGGFVLAIGVIGVLISFFTGKKVDVFGDDE